MFSLSRYLEGLEVTTFDDEPNPTAIGLYRVVFWPTSRARCCVTVRDLGDMGEVELVSNAKPTVEQGETPKGARPGPAPKGTWREQTYVEEAPLTLLRTALIVANPDQCVDAINRLSRDGVSVGCEVRRTREAPLVFEWVNQNAPATRAFVLAVLDFAESSLSAPESRGLLRDARANLPHA